MIEKFAHITRVLKQNKACKPEIPTINQIKKYLKPKAKAVERRDQRDQ